MECRFSITLANWEKFLKRTKWNCKKTKKGHMKCWNSSYQNKYFYNNHFRDHTRTFPHPYIQKFMSVTKISVCDLEKMMIDKKIKISQ